MHLVHSLSDGAQLIAKTRSVVLQITVLTRYVFRRGFLQTMLRYVFRRGFLQTMLDARQSLGLTAPMVPKIYAFAWLPQVLVFFKAHPRRARFRRTRFVNIAGHMAQVLLACTQTNSTTSRYFLLVVAVVASKRPVAVNPLGSSNHPRRARFRRARFENIAGHTAQVSLACTQTNSATSRYFLLVAVVASKQPVAVNPLGSSREKLAIKSDL